MALAVTHPTLLDVTRRLDPGGKIDKIGEILNQTNEILDDMVLIEGNLPTGHRTTVRTDIPSATWRKLNYGVQPVRARPRRSPTPAGCWKPGERRQNHGDREQ